MALTPSGAPEPPEFSPGTRLLVIAPHPDDETLATGLLVQQVRAAGGTVRIVLLTAGDNNPWPQRWLERRVHVGAGDRQRWGERRRAEMLQAMQRLGLPAEALECLGWPDMGLTGLLLHQGGDAVAALAASIARFNPCLVALPALADRHPDHSAAHVLGRLALARLGSTAARLDYLVHGLVPADGCIEVRGSPAQVAAKLAALSEHRSQTALSGGRMRRLASRAERYAVRFPTPAPSPSWHPPGWLRPWLRLSVVGSDGSDGWNWRDLPLGDDGAGVCLPCSTGEAGGPRFARLASTLPSPWIFDHWGWCELPPAATGLA